MTVDTTPRHPWLQLPDENAQQYAAFERYRDLGAGRSLELVIEQMAPAQALLQTHDETHRTLMRNLARTDRLDTDSPFSYQVVVWSSRFRWVFRAEQFDRHVAWMAAEKVAAEHSAMLERHVKISMQLQEKALSRLREMDPSELTAKEALAYLKDAITLERSSREAPRGVPSHLMSDVPQMQERKVLADVFAILVESGALPEGSDFDMAEGIIDAKAHQVHSARSDAEADGVPADSTP